MSENIEKTKPTEGTKSDSVSQEVPAARVDLDSVSTPTPPVHTATSVPTTTPVPEGEKAADRVLPNEEALRLALQKGVLNHGPVHDLGASQSAPRQKCSTCGQSKAAHQPWEDHNCSEGHIKNLINKRGFFAAIGLLDKEYSKYLTVKCELCHTSYSNILLYNAHKLTEEHRRRSEELLRLVRIGVQYKTIGKWDKVSKPKKTSAKEISSVIRHFNHHNSKK